MSSIGRHVRKMCSRQLVESSRSLRPSFAGQNRVDLGVIVLLVATASSLGPSPLTDASLEVRNLGLDVLHNGLNGLLGLVAVAVESTLQEDRATRKHSTLEPGHAVAKVVEAHLLATHSFAQLGDGNLQIRALITGSLDHRLAASAKAASSPATIRVGVAIIFHVGQILLEEPRSSGARWRTLHLSGEVTSGVYRRALAEGVGDLASVDAIESDSDAETALSIAVLDKNELALLGLGDVGEQTLGLLGARALGTGATGRNRVTVAQGVLQRGHGGTGSRRASRVAVATVEDVSLADIGASSGRLASGSLVVVVVLVVHVVWIAWEKEQVSLHSVCFRYEGSAETTAALRKGVVGNRNRGGSRQDKRGMDGGRKLARKATGG